MAVTAMTVDPFPTHLGQPLPCQYEQDLVPSDNSVLVKTDMTLVTDANVLLFVVFIFSFRRREESPRVVQSTRHAEQNSIGQYSLTKFHAFFWFMFWSSVTRRWQA